MHFSLFRFLSFPWLYSPIMQDQSLCAFPLISLWSYLLLAVDEKVTTNSAFLVVFFFSCFFSFGVLCLYTWLFWVCFYGVWRQQHSSALKIWMPRESLWGFPERVRSVSNISKSHQRTACVQMWPLDLNDSDIYSTIQWRGLLHWYTVGIKGFQI